MVEMRAKIGRVKKTKRKVSVVNKKQSELIRKDNWEEEQALKTGRGSVSARQKQASV